MTNWLSPNPFGSARSENPFRGSGKRLSGVVNIDELAKMFGLPEWDTIEEMNQEYIFESSRGAETDEEREKAEQSAQEELYGKHHDAVESVAEELFDEHGLKLVPKWGRRDKQRRRAYEYTVTPEISWEDAANKIRQTINGVGMFEFSSTKEFLDSGPWTAREAVLGHLHWIKHYPDVYGSASARSMYERAWR